MIKIGVIGFGYWGPNLVRNFYKNNDCIVKKIVDRDSKKLALAKKLYPNVEISKSIDSMIKDKNIDAIAIALPVSDHFEITKKALFNGKSVLIEKPMTNSKEKAQQLIDIATKKDKILMVDHTFLYSGAVKKIRELIINNYNSITGVLI